MGELDPEMRGRHVVHVDTDLRTWWNERGCLVSIPRSMGWALQPVFDSWPEPVLIEIVTPTYGVRGLVTAYSSSSEESTELHVASWREWPPGVPRTLEGPGLSGDCEECMGVHMREDGRRGVFSCGKCGTVWEVTAAAAPSAQGT